jgi:hypothetical protein
MAARSFGIKVENWTGTPFKLVEKHLDHGEWSNNGNDTPPESLQSVHLDDKGDAQPGKVEFGSESDGLATGTQGGCTYRATKDPIVDLQINWDNPYIGSNGFGASAKGFNVSWGSIDGNDANVTVKVVH